MIPLSRYGAVVIGSGPVGMVAALELSKYCRTALVTQALPDGNAPARIEAVPAAMLTVLLDWGVHPLELGVSSLYERRIHAWESAVPEGQPGPAMAHVERPRLDVAVLRRVVDEPQVELIITPVSGHLVQEISNAAAGLCVVIDATGRQSVSAGTRLGPPSKWAARIFGRQYSDRRIDGAFRVAALPNGYAYRLGTDRSISIGLVGPMNLLPTTAQNALSVLKNSSADWILEGLSPLETMQTGRSALTSVQWAVGGSTLRIGDAALTRDALSSQGLSCGISEALYAAAVQTEADRALFRLRQTEQRDCHLQSLTNLIAKCHHRDAVAWNDYAQFLQRHSSEPRTSSRVVLQEDRLEVIDGS